MDSRHKNRVIQELHILDRKLIEMAVNLKPHTPEQLSREALAATADVLQGLYNLRVDLQVRMYEFIHGPDQGEA